MACYFSCCCAPFFGVDVLFRDVDPRGEGVVRPFSFFHCAGSCFLFRLCFRFLVGEGQCYYGRAGDQGAVFCVACCSYIDVGARCCCGFTALCPHSLLFEGEFVRGERAFSPWLAVVCGIYLFSFDVDGFYTHFFVSDFGFYGLVAFAV